MSDCSEHGHSHAHEHYHRHGPSPLLIIGGIAIVAMLRHKRRMMLEAAGEGGVGPWAGFAGHRRGRAAFGEWARRHGGAGFGPGFRGMPGVDEATEA